ncbi:hypothetical protein [Spirosoma knui]
MFTVMSNLIGAILVSAAALSNPTNPKGLSFDASAFVTAKNQIRLSVVKPTTEPLTVVLRDEKNHVLYEKYIPRYESKPAILFNVDELADGQYEIEIRSAQGSIRKQVKLMTSQQPQRLITMQAE